MKVCVVGSTMIDLVTRVPRLPKIGETLVGRSFSVGYGGKGGNQAVIAALLGADVRIVTRVGNDFFGESALRNYRAYGVDVRHARVDAANASGVAPIFVDDVAQNCVIVVPGANAALSIDDVAAATATIGEADVVVAQLEVPVATVLAALRIARSGRRITILNPAPAVAVPPELWTLVDVAAPNESEAEALTGVALRSDDDAARAGAILRERGARAAIVTLGERGCVVVDEGGTQRIEPLRVRAEDPTGAGDAFVGTLAVALGAGLPLRAAARRANAVAALSVTKAGTHASYPDRSAADAFLAEHGLAMRG